MSELVHCLGAHLYSPNKVAVPVCRLEAVVCRQSERGQLIPSGCVILVKNASHAQTLCDGDEHGCVVDKSDLVSRCLSKVEREAKDAGIRLAHMNKAGRDEGVSQLVQLECANPVRIYRSRFIADHDDLQFVLSLELKDEFDHLPVGLGLSEHEVAELVPREYPLFMKDDPVEILLEGESSFFVRLEDQAMTLVHLRPIQMEVPGCPFAGQMIPAIGEQHPADVDKQRPNRNPPLLGNSGNFVLSLCHAVLSGQILLHHVKRRSGFQYFASRP
jgi:hypothetical protein